MHRPNATLGAVALTCALLMTTVAACGRSSEVDEKLTTANDAFAPSLEMLKAVRGALPPVGQEKDMQCTKGVDKDALVTIDAPMLNYLLGDTIKEDKWDRKRLTSKELSRLAPQSELAGLEEKEAKKMARRFEKAAKALGKAKHIVVLRPTEVTIGKVGKKDKYRSYKLDEPAWWKGWMLLVSVEDPKAPKLVGSLHMEATHGPSVWFSKKKGYRPNKSVLIQDVTKRLRKQIMARLTGDTCMSTRTVRAARCEKSDGEACYQLALANEGGKQLYTDGIWVTFDKDPAKAQTLFEKACTTGKGHGRACNRTAKLHVKDPAKAAGFYKKSCDTGNAIGCNNFANALSSGAGVEKNRELATKLYRAACTAKLGVACYNAANMLPKDAIERITLNSSACLNGFKKACSRRKR